MKRVQTTISDKIFEDGRNLPLFTLLYYCMLHVFWYSKIAVKTQHRCSFSYIFDLNLNQHLTRISNIWPPRLSSSNSCLKMSQRASDSVSSVLSIISNYQKLAEDKEKRYFLAKDHACVQFLAYVLDDNSSDVVLLTLKVLQLLVENAENTILVSKVFGVKQALQKLLTCGYHSKEILSIAEDVYRAVTTVDQRVVSQTNPLKEKQNKAQSNSSLPKKFNNCRAVQIVLKIQGIKNKSDREKCVDLLVKVRGVVSIMFDVTCTRCTVRAKREVTPDILIAIIEANRTFTAHQLVNNENGVELVRPRIVFNQSISVNETDDKENEKLPEYLPEEDDDDKSNCGTMVRSGNSHSKAGGWFNSAATFLTKSFYW